MKILSKISSCLAGKLLAVAFASTTLSLLYCCPLSASQEKYTIKQDGTGDFASISEAVAAVPSNSTLIISEGVYNEQVMITDKTIHLEGTDRENCILQYNGNNYFEPPLSVAAGKISNLTIYSYADKNGNWIDCPPAVVDPSIPQTFYKEYAVHIEQNYLFGKELIFDNCLFLSDKNQCIGLGLRGDSNVAFQNCEFRAYGPGGIILVHDSAFEEYSGNCALRFTDCTLYNYNSPYFFNVQCLSLSNRVNLTFQNVAVHTVGYSDTRPYVAQNDYTGKTIDNLISLDTDELLIENGYKKNDFVFCLNEEESSRYHAAVMFNTSSINNKIFLPEGITRVLNEQPTSEFHSALPIHINNLGLDAQNGWCGSANFYLTPDSYGNTFAEMNYQETIISP